MVRSYKPVVGFRLSPDIVKFIEDHGKARRTDPSRGRYNFSELVEGFLRQYVAGQEPVIIAQVYKEELDQIEAQRAVLEKKVRGDLGIPLTSLDDFVASHTKTMTDQIAHAKVQARDRATRILSHIRNEYRKHEPANPEAWLTGRFRDEMKVLGLTVAEMLREVQNDGH